MSGMSVARGDYCKLSTEKAMEKATEERMEREQVEMWVSEPCNM